MSVSPYTLNNLYNQGVLDYAPYDLCTGVNMNNNLYMQNAMQGSLYQNYGSGSDMFVNNGVNGGVNNSIGFNNLQTGMNGFGGVNGNTGFNNSQAGMNGFGGVNGNIISNNPQAGINGFGGGFGELGQKISNVPTFVKGLVSGALILGTAILCLRGKKKPPVQEQGFFSKLKFWKKNK